MTHHNFSKPYWLQTSLFTIIVFPNLHIIQDYNTSQDADAVISDV